MHLLRCGAIGEGLSSLSARREGMASKEPAHARPTPVVAHHRHIGGRPLTSRRQSLPSCIAILSALPSAAVRSLRSVVTSALLTLARGVRSGARRAARGPNGRGRAGYSKGLAGRGRSASILLLTEC